MQQVYASTSAYVSRLGNAQMNWMIFALNFYWFINLQSNNNIKNSQD